MGKADEQLYEDFGHRGMSAEKGDRDETLVDMSFSVALSDRGTG
jgi:hypothetical protein